MFDNTRILVHRAVAFLGVTLWMATIAWFIYRDYTATEMPEVVAHYVPASQLSPAWAAPSLGPKVASSKLPTFAPSIPVGYRSVSVGTNYTAAPLHLSSQASVHSYGGGTSAMSVAMAGSKSTASSDGSMHAAAPAMAVANMHFQTSATSLRGGRMAAEAGYLAKAPGGPGGPGVPDDQAPCTSCIDLDHDGECDRCGCEMTSCGCAEESGYCWCPLDASTFTALPMLLMACVYILAKKSFFGAFCVRFVAGFKKKQYLCRRKRTKQH